MNESYKSSEDSLLEDWLDSQEESSELMEDLKDCAFNILHDNPGITQQDWESLMIYRYGVEICDCFGPDSDRWDKKLWEMFMHDSYIDELTGEKYKFSEWSEIFANKLSVEIYDKLVEARAKIKPVDSLKFKK